MPEPPGWLLDLALALADDPDEQTGDSILQGFRRGVAARLTEDPVFLDRLLGTEACRRDVAPVVEACDRLDRLTPLADRILKLAAAAASHGQDVPDSWKHYRHVSSVVGLLARLAEEAERNSDFGLRAEALDAWDRLLEAGVDWAIQAFDERVKEG